MTYLRTEWTRLFLLAFVLGLNSAAEAEIDESQSLDLQRLMGLMAQVTSRQARFTETKTLTVLTKPMILTGILFYVYPDRLEKHVITPHEEHLIVQGNQLTLTTNDGTKRMQVKSHPLIESLVETIRASLSGNLATLRHLYHVTLDGSQQDWSLTLRPRDQQAAAYLTSITLHGRNSQLTSVEMREANGDQSVMTIHEPAS